ncbi:MAG: tRNA-intron lyase [Candidatus Odinarchaeia archaeon]
MSEEQPVAIGVIREDNKVVVEGSAAQMIHNKGHYGRFEEGKLILEPVEVLLLFERKRLKVKDSAGKELTFHDILNRFLDADKNIWTKYLVYRDLRSRGYTVSLGFGSGIDFRVYDRGAVIDENAAKYLVHVIVEGKPMQIAELEKIVKMASSSRKKLALALVDRQGEPTYYFVSEIELKKSVE